MTSNTVIAIVGTEMSGKTLLTNLLMNLPYQEYTPTTSVARHSFNEKITLLDVPGNSKYNKTLCASLTEADACILCVSPDTSDRTLELLIILQTFQIPCLCCVTPLEVSEERIRKLFTQAGFTFIPRLIGRDKLTEVPELFKFPIKRDVNPGPLVAAIVAVSQCPEGLLVKSSIHTGALLDSLSELFLHPGGVAVKVLKVASVAGRHLEVIFSGEDRRLISKGMILADSPDISSKQFKAEIVIIGRAPNGIKSGFVGVVNWLNMQTPMKLEIESKIDKTTGYDWKSQDEPHCLHAGDHAKISLTS